MENLDGILIINKPKAYTSHDIVAKVRKILNIKKVGHTGTLDPNATGVLPLLLGNGTKLSNYLIDHDKVYETTIKLGQKRDTADGEGNVIEERTVPIELLKKENIEKILDSFLGEQQQIPPIYSAIKKNGKKLYEYARKGQEVKVDPREIEIYNIELRNINIGSLEVTFKVSCSKGTYIRTLCEDVADRLHTVGYMKELKRLKVGQFTIEESISIDELENIKKDNKLNQYIVSIERFFYNKEEIFLDIINLQRFLNGVNISCEKQEEKYRIYDNKNHFIGIGIIKENRLKREIIVQ